MTTLGQPGKVSAKAPEKSVFPGRCMGARCETGLSPAPPDTPWTKTG
jgi:hypothetical protein